MAITRAKRQLYLLCARQRMLFGRTTANRASRFIDEIPEEHIDNARAVFPDTDVAVDGMTITLQYP